MKLATMFMTFIFGLGAFAANLECSSEAGDFFVKINEDELNGYIDIDSVCVLLECNSSRLGYDCRGFFDNKAYYVTYMGSSGAFVNRVNGTNYDTLGYLNCTQISEGTTPDLE